MNIYRSQTGKEKSLALYDRQLLKLNMPFSDIYVKTSFGKTHLVEIGNKTGKPLLVFHGGNATTAYNLLMCIAPSKIDKAVFIVPAGISNAVPVSSMAMLIPLLQYRITKREKYLVKTALYMALREEVLDEDTIAILKDSFDNVKIKAAMPANIEKKRWNNYCSPTLIIAGEKDCLFPARKVLRRAEKIIPDCQTVELRDSGHMHILPQTEKERIVDFLRK